MGALAAVARGATPSRGWSCCATSRRSPRERRPRARASSARRSRSTPAASRSSPPLHMEDMKGDMAGGAAVIEATGAIAELGLPMRVHRGRRGLPRTCPAATPTGPATSSPRRTARRSRVTNTDAEGRLVLADALWYARQSGATHILDLATLTGAMELALGDLYAGVFANDDGVARPDRCRRRGERRPRLAVADAPALPPLRRLGVRRPEELVRPAPGRRRATRPSSSKEFAGEGPWAHADIAGPALPARSRGDYLEPARRHGYGVRLIAELASRLGRVNFDLPPEHELVRAHRPRVRGASGSRRSPRSSTASTASRTSSSRSWPSSA